MGLDNFSGYGSIFSTTRRKKHILTKETNGEA